MSVGETDPRGQCAFASSSAARARPTPANKEDEMKLNRLVSAALAFAMAFVLTTGVAFAAEAAPAGKVNINTANATQLSALPGIGEKLATRIVEYRQKAGGFLPLLHRLRGVGGSPGKC